MSDLNFDANFEDYVSFKANFGIVTSTAAVVDPTVTEDSPNPVASSGIYTFVKDEVSAEKTSRDAAIFAESQERLKGDEDIQRYVTSKIEAEESARSSADTDLANSISELSSNTVKTVNHIAPDAEGNVNVEGGGSGLVDDVKVNGVSVVADKVANVAVPTKVSSLENDAGYITQIPQIPTKLSQMTNDVDFTTKGYVDEEISKIPAPPTKTSQLTNDSGYITSADVPAPYDDTEIRSELANKIEDSALTPLRNNISTLTSQMANKQDKLVSGTNIKTINGNSLLGSGDITIGGGSGTVKTVNNIGPDASGNVALPLGRIDDPVGRTEYANNYKLTGDGKCAGNNNYQLWKWAVVEGAEYKIETTGFWQFQNTSSVSTSSTAALIGEVQTGSQDKVIVPTGASWLILEVPKTETSIVYRILRESSAGGEAVNKAYVDQQNALQDAEITSVKADLTNLDDRVDVLEKMSKGILYDFVTQTVDGTQNVPKGSHLADLQKLEGKSVVWNQLFDFNNIRSSSNGISFTFSSNKISYSGTSTSSYALFVRNFMTIPKGHKLYCKSVGSDRKIDVRDYVDDQSTYLHNYLTNQSIIFTVSNGNVEARFVELTSGETYTGEFSFVLVDLTQMFGAGNEPTVEQFEAMFAEDYYPYNIGELQSVDNSKMTIKGRNLFKGDAEITGLSYGQTVPESVQYKLMLGSQDIRFEPNVRYTFSFDLENPNTTITVLAISVRYSDGTADQIYAKNSGHFKLTTSANKVMRIFYEKRKNKLSYSSIIMTNFSLVCA